MTEIDTDMLCVMDLREKVAKAIHESNRIVPWEQTCQQDIAFERADAAIAVVLEEAKTAVRHRMVAQEWPPQDGDQQIDEVLEAIDALSRSGGK